VTNLKAQCWDEANLAANFSLGGAVAAVPAAVCVPCSYGIARLSARRRGRAVTVLSRNDGVFSLILSEMDRKTGLFVRCGFPDFM
jgi:hypothetical protein